MIRTTELFTIQDPYITAASGLTLVNDRFYLVADDELGIVSLDMNGNGKFIKVFEGKLPEEKKERKKLKPDFESLLYLPARNALLCLPSGSRPNRVRAAVVSLEGNVQELMLENVMTELGAIFPELNIEGAVLLNEKIRLFQRGNGSLHQNAIIDLNLNSFLKDEIKDIKIKEITLPPLMSFTDAGIFNEVCWFIAVAENTESTYLDGEFMGAMLGKLSTDGKVIATWPLDIKSKPEGIAFKDSKFYLVTDDDDRTKPSKLYSGVLP